MASEQSLIAFMFCRVYKLLSPIIENKLCVTALTSGCLTGRKGIWSILGNKSDAVFPNVLCWRTQPYVEQLRPIEQKLWMVANFDGAKFG